MSVTGCRRNSNDVTTPKFPPPPRSAQNRSSFSASLAVSALPVGGDHLGRDEVVAREADAPRQVADAAAEREPAHAGRGDDAAGRREAVRVRGVVEHAPRGAALGAGRPGLGIDLNVRHAGQVDDDRVVGGAEAGHAVATAAHGQVELVLARVVHGRDHVVGGRAAHDDARPPVDHRVEDLARLVVACVARRDHLAADALAEPVDRLRAMFVLPFAPYVLSGQPRLERVQPVVKYTKTGDFNIAYQVVGDGPVDLLLLPGWITHLELQWDVPPLGRFLERLAGFSRLILFDKAGTGPLRSSFALRAADAGATDGRGARRHGRGRLRAGSALRDDRRRRDVRTVRGHVPRARARPHHLRDLQPPRARHGAAGAARSHAGGRARARRAGMGNRGRERVASGRPASSRTRRRSRRISASPAPQPAPGRPAS